MAYQVLDNGKPADCHHHKVHFTWDQSTFDTLAGALAHARNWLGAHGHGVVLKVNEPVDYSGYGDMIEIREVP